MRNKRFIPSTTKFMESVSRRVFYTQRTRKQKDYIKLNLVYIKNMMIIIHL